MRNTRTSCRTWAAERCLTSRFTGALAAALLLLCTGAPGQALTLDPVKDAVLLGVGAGIAGGSELWSRIKPPTAPGAVAAEAYPAAELDLATMFPYSRDADIASSVFQVAAIAVPAVFLLSTSRDQALSEGVVYAESLSFAIGAKNAVKFLVPRYRPYTYTGGAPGVSPGDDEQSFPSGHAAVAFAAAGFSTYLLVQGLPDTAWFVPYVVADYGLAFLAGSYRVFSGMHFVSDVVAGAALGLLCGFLLPAVVHKP
jgi:membrane-associated phospholipid phosphatase